MGDWKILPTTAHSICRGEKRGKERRGEKKEKRKKERERRMKKKGKRERKKKKKKFVNSHAGNRTPATAVRAPDPNH